MGEVRLMPDIVLILRQQWFAPRPTQHQTGLSLTMTGLTPDDVGIYC